MKTKHILSRSVATLLALGTCSAHAAQQTITASGDPTVNTGSPAWGTDANWSGPNGALKPTATDNAVITYAGTAAAGVDIRGSGLGGATTIQDLTFAGAGTGAVTLENNSTGSSLILTLNGGRGAGVPLISTGTYAVTIPVTGPGTTQTLTVKLAVSGEINVGTGGLTLGALLTESSVGKSITKTGAGRLTVSNSANAFTGGATVSNGILEVTGNGVLGTGAITVNGGTLEVNFASATLTNSSITVNAGGQIATRGLVTINNAITLSGGTLATRSTDTDNYAGTINVSANSFVALKSYSTPANSQSINISGQLTGSGSLDLSGNNTGGNGGGNGGGKALILTNTTNSYSGTFNVLANQILLSKPAATGNTLGTGTVNLNGGTLQLRDNGSGSGGTLAYNNNVTVSASGTIDVDRVSANLGNTFQLGTLNLAAGQTLNTTGANTYVVRFGGATTLNAGAAFNPTTAPIVLGGVVGGAADLTKTGSGILQLTAANTYTGQTNVNAGTLTLIGSIASSPVIRVGAGATLDVTAAAGGFILSSTQTLAGAGSVTGAATVGNGGKIQPGDGAGTGTLTMAALTFGTAAGQTGAVNITNSATPALLNVTGSNALVANGGANSISINLPTSAPAAGTYTLIDYVGAIGGTGFSAFKLGTGPNRLVANLVNNVGNTSIDLNVTGIDFPLWKGALGSEWSTATLAAPKNWVLNSNNATGTDFLTSDNVTFSDLATTTTADVSVADVTPASVLFSNVTKDYVISGSKAITGAGAFTVNGGGKVTVSNTNSFTSAPSLLAGTVSVAAVANGGVNSPLGAGTSVVFGGGTLEFTGVSGSTDRAVTLNAGGGTVQTATALTLAGAIGGAGALTKTGGGTLTLTGANTYGATTISGGTLQIGDGVAPSSPGTGPITDNATLVFNTPAAGLIVGNQITGTGALTKTGVGNTVLNGAQANIFSGDTTVSGGNLILSKTSGVNAIGGNLIVALGGSVSYGTTAGQLADHLPDTASITINGGTFGSGAGDTLANPTQGVSETVASVTVNSGSFLSGRGGSSAAPLPFVVAGDFKLLGGTALVQRGGGLTAAGVQIGAAVLSLDGGSNTAGNQSRLTTGAGGLTLAGGTINFNAGPSALVPASVGSIVTLDGDVTSTGTSSLVRQNPAVSSASVNLGGATRTFAVTGTLTIGTATAPITITNGALTKTGAGVLNLTGPQTYTTLQTSGGVTNLRGAIGTGTSTLNANAATNIFTSQTLAALSIGAGAIVTFGDGLPLVGGPEKFEASAVPEPGALSLLLLGGLGMLGRRRSWRR